MARSSRLVVVDRLSRFDLVVRGRGHRRARRSLGTRRRRRGDVTVAGVVDALELPAREPHVLWNDPPRHGAADSDKRKDGERVVEVLARYGELERREEDGEEVGCVRT